jgi:hypothetical protein
MLKPVVASMLIVGLMAISAPAFANCGGHCQQMKRCGEIVREKHVPKGQGQAEFNKCMMDPVNYK